MSPRAEQLRIAIIGGIFQSGGALRPAFYDAPETLLARELRGLGTEVKTFSPRDRFDPSEFSLIHIHHMHFGALWAAAQSHRTRLVYTGHDGLLLQRGASGPRRLAYRVVIPRMDALIASSEQERTLQSQLLRRLPPIHAVVPNPLETSRFFPAARHHCPTSGQFRILYVGQLIKLKNVESLIRALSALSSRYVLDLIYRNRQSENALRHLATELGVSDRIRFRPGLSNNDVALAYRDASCFVLPSIAESYPSVVTEALLSGTPLIATSVGGVPDQVQDGGILLPRADPESLVRAIERMECDYDFFATKALESGRRLRMLHNPSKVAREHLAVYAQCLSTPRNPSVVTTVLTNHAVRGVALAGVMLKKFLD